MKKISFSFFNNFSKKQRIVIYLLIFFVFIDLFLCVSVLFARKYSSIKLNSVIYSQNHAMLALDSNGHKAFIKENGYATFKFTEIQKNIFFQVYEKYGSSALTLRIKIFPTDEQLSRIQTNDLLKIGFLYEKDFNSRGKYIQQKYPVNNRIEVQAEEKDFSGIVDISFALPKNSNYEYSIPCGFYIYSSERCRILDACISEAYIGFDISKEIPFYGFACNGGKIDFSNTHFDFSGSAMVFQTEASVKNILPQYEVIFSSDEAFFSTLDEIKRTEMNIGGEKFYLNNVETGEKLIIPAGGLKNPFGRMELIKNKEMIVSVLMKQHLIFDETEVVSPIKTDPGLILNYKQNQWRTLDYEIFQWDRFPEILFFDIRDLKTQELFFSRLAYFVEKEGYKGKLLTNEQLQGKHGYNAHDYSSESLAEFFNAATESHFSLNKEELILKEILLKNGLLEESNGLVKANEGGIVSISRETPDWSRTNLLAHEGWHTLYFKDEEFRNFCSAVYYTFDEKSRAFLLDYFKSQSQLGYDQSDDYLIINEFMAYIMQQRLNSVGEYFVHCANRGTVMRFTPDLSAYVRQTQGRGFEDAAIALNSFVFDKYGIICGNIALVNRY